MQGLKIDAGLLDEMLYCGVVVGGGWTCMVQGGSICLAGHLHGLVSVQNIRGLSGFLSSI